MAKYRCEAQAIIEKEFDAKDEETAEMMMEDYMYEEFSNLDWIVSVYKN